MKRSPLNRYTPLKAKKQWRPKKKNDSDWQTARKQALARSRGRCEAKWDGCWGTSDHVHHMRRRSQGGGNELSNLLVCCAYCHDQIHRNPQQAFEKQHLFRTTLQEPEGHV